MLPDQILKDQNTTESAYVKQCSGDLPVADLCWGTHPEECCFSKETAEICYREGPVKKTNIFLNLTLE